MKTKKQVIKSNLYKEYRAYCTKHNVTPKLYSEKWKRDYHYLKTYCKDDRPAEVEYRLITATSIDGVLSDMEKQNPDKPKLIYWLNKEEWDIHFKLVSITNEPYTN